MGDDAFYEGEDAVLLVNEGGEMEKEKVQTHLSTGGDYGLWDCKPVKRSLEEKKTQRRLK